ncbi:hypothetical protein [Bacillus safensis]|uniref:hypothetical protein n=1 Tax=Bacillus safensis TaxID=561879 RepID=UPI0020CBB2EA|nr:hypothetical protein [Bacillus safensis]MCP9283618.1 hypothetical protein [Bacillus safensis]
MKNSIILSLVTVSFLFISGCSEDKGSDKEDPSKPKEEAAKEKKKTESPKIDENCEEVYSKEECEKFAEYYQSDEGQKEGEQPKEKSDNAAAENEMYDYVAEIIDTVLSGSSKYTLAPIEETTIVKRDDGLYYVNSSYELKGTNVRGGDGRYSFELLISDDFEIKDGYFPGSTGRFSRPMKYDEVQEYKRQLTEQAEIEKANETPEDRERKKKEAEQKEKEHQKTMDSIYGEKKDRDMTKETLGEDE